MKNVTVLTKSQLDESAILETLKKDGIIVIKDFYSLVEVDSLKAEFDRIFIENEQSIKVLAAEDCSSDQRISHMERYSALIKTMFSDNTFLDSVAEKYINTFLRKNTVGSNLEYSSKEIRNSGGGWHRDNHELQFKALLYLTETTERNGNFQWITNSSQRQVGFPTSRTPSYNTRFNDTTIETLILNEEECTLVDIVGTPGTVVVANTSYIHRGNLIEEGTRKSLTQYYMSKD